MKVDPTKYDTSRLIAGVDSTGRFSVEDILEEFADPEQVQEQMQVLEPENVPQESVSSGDVAEAETSSSPETGQEVPMESQSPADFAEAIAQAVASSAEVSEVPETMAVAPDVDAIEVDTAPGQEESEQAAEQMPPEPQGAKAIPNVKTVQDPQLRKAAREKKTVKKRQKPPVGSGAVSLIGEVAGTLRSVQRSDLPASRTSLKAAEKRSAMLVRISGMMAPVRYIVLMLMALSLAGRRFAWMSLGFLGGSTGVAVALVCALIAMITAWQSLLGAMRDVAHLRLTYEPLLLLVTLMSMIDTAVHKDPKTLLPLLVMAWCVTGTSALMKNRADLRALRGVIAGRNRKAVRMTQNQWEHRDCLGKAPASTAGFVRRMEEMDTFHSGWSAYSLLLLAVCLIVGAYLSAKTKGNYFTILVTLLTVTMPVSLALCCARPYELLTRAMGGAAAPAGCSGMQTMSGKKAMLIYDEDLFPKQTIGHKGVRVYGNQTPRLLTSYAASLIFRADNGLVDVFTGLLREMDGRIYDVSYFQVLDAGLAGRINGVVVAVGTYNFMQLLGAIPPVDAPKNGVFIAINGELAGVFAIRYRVRSGAVEGFERLTRERSLTTLMATRNFCINPSFLRKWFQVPVAAVTCPKWETRLSLSQPGLLAHGVTCGYVMKGGIAAYSRLVAGGRRVYRMGLLLTLLSVVLSVLMLVLTASAISAGVPIYSGARLLLIQLLLFFGVEFWARISVR